MTSNMAKPTLKYKIRREKSLVDPRWINIALANHEAAQPHDGTRTLNVWILVSCLTLAQRSSM